MNNKAQKLQTYCGQLTALLARMPSHAEAEDIEELIEELKEDASAVPLNAKPILDINKEIREALVKTGEIAPDEQKYVKRALRVTDRVIRAFNLSGTEKILKGAELKAQWARRTAMGRGELDPPRYDGKGNLFFGIIEGRLYEDGMKVNGIRDGFLYYNGKKLDGWHDDGFYYRGGLRHTGTRLTYKDVIRFENGKEVGREPRTDV